MEIMESTSTGGGDGGAGGDTGEHDGPAQPKANMQRRATIHDDAKNPMARKFQSTTDRVTADEKKRLAELHNIRAIFMNALPEERRKSMDTSTAGMMMKARFLPPRLPEELTVERNIIIEPDKIEPLLPTRHNDGDDDSDDEEELVVSIKNNQALFDETNLVPGASLLNIDKKRRFAMSLATLASRPIKRMTIVKEGAIQVLKQLSSNPDDVVQRCCSAAFSFLTVDANTRTRVLEEGGAAAVAKLTLASNQNLVVKHNCVRAICNLAVTQGSEARLVKDGCLPALMNIMTYCPESVDLCLLSLFNMSTVQDRFTRIEEMTEVLMRLQNSLNNHAQEHMYLTVLCNLSAIRGNQLRMVEDGVQRVVDRVRKSHNLELRTIGANIFGNFCTDSRAKAKMVENHAIPTMINMLQDTSEPIRGQSVKAFHSLSKDLQLRHKVVYNEKAVSLLLLLGRDHYDDVSYGRYLARVYRSLCKEALISAKLVREGVVESIQHLTAVRAGQDQDQVIVHYCMESLCSLFDNDEVVHDLVNGNNGLGVRVLIEFADRAVSSEPHDGLVLEWAAYVMYRLCLRGACSRELLQDQILPCVVRLTACVDVKPRYFCAGILKLVSQHHAVNTSMAILPVIDMMRTDTNPVTQRNCAASLANMIHDSDNCAIMLKSGALPYIVRLSGTDVLVTKMKCAAIFSRLSIHEQYFSEFARDDVMQVLLGLCTVDHLVTQRWVVMALSNLSYQNSLRDLLLELKPVPHLISMAAKRDETLRRGCAAILCNLACRDGSEQVLIDAGVVASLLVTAMIASDQTIAKVICVKALINLMGDPSTHAQLAKEGVIWCLSSLTLAKDVDLSTLCMKALSVFATNFSREMLESPASTKAILWAIGVTDVGLQLLGARTLVMMLRHSGAGDIKFRKDAAEAMMPLASCADPEVVELCVVAMCYVSQSDVCCAPLAASGINLEVNRQQGNRVFSDPVLAQAYLTFVDNVANDSAVRGSLLKSPGAGDLMLHRFQQVAELRDEAVLVATAKALYSLSCAHENVTVLASRGVLALLRALWAQQAEHTTATTSSSSTQAFGAAGEQVHPAAPYLIACMYNLSSHPSAQARLVSDGFMDLLVEMFRTVKHDKTLCVMACYATFHMACGATSSARLVESGCASILCFIKTAEGKAMYKTFPDTFTLDLQLRCAMSIRNMICVVANQRPLVEAGCIEALVELAEEAQIELGGPALEHPKLAEGLLRKGISFKEVRKPASVSSRIRLTQKQEEDRAIAAMIRKNAAAALRCLTFNHELREHLEPSGAVIVLLEDLTQDMHAQEAEFKMDYSLLSELEAESWQNGSRGRQKEGRAPHIPPAPLNLDLLRATKEVSLDAVAVAVDPLEKFTVKVDLEETAQAGAAGAGVSKSALGDEDVLEDTLAGLTKFPHVAEDSEALVAGQLSRRTVDVLPIGEAIHPTPAAQLARYAEVLGGIATGPPSLRHLSRSGNGSLLSSSKASSDRLGAEGLGETVAAAAADVSHGFMAREDSMLRMSQQAGPGMWASPTPTGGGTADGTVESSVGNRAHGLVPPSTAPAGLSTSRRVVIVAPGTLPNVVKPSTAALSSSGRGAGTGLGSGPGSGGQSPGFQSFSGAATAPNRTKASGHDGVDLPPIVTGGTASATGLAGLDFGVGSILSLDSIKKAKSQKGHFSKREQRYNDLVALINSTKKAKSFNVETVLKQYKELGNL